MRVLVSGTRSSVILLNCGVPRQCGVVTASYSMRSPGTLWTNFHGPLPIGLSRNPFVAHRLDVLLGHHAAFHEDGARQAGREVRDDALGGDAHGVVVQHLDLVHGAAERGRARRDRLRRHDPLEAELDVVAGDGIAVVELAGPCGDRRSSSCRRPRASSAPRRRGRCRPSRDRTRRASPRSGRGSARAEPACRQMGSMTWAPRVSSAMTSVSLSWALTVDAPATRPSTAATPTTTRIIRARMSDPPVPAGARVPGFYSGARPIGNINASVPRRMKLGSIAHRRQVAAAILALRGGGAHFGGSRRPGHAGGGCATLFLCSTGGVPWRT